MSDTTPIEESAVSPNQETENMPRFDPEMLLSMAAMQMPTKQLALALVSLFDGHAWKSMGLVADYVTGETKEDLSAAQLAIDIVQFLLGKVESELSESERQEAQRRLKDLRINYVNRLSK